MAVSYKYLEKVRLAVRLDPDPALDEELTDMIEECRLDLESLGVLDTRANDETDRLILGAVRCFVRWKNGDERTAALNREDYMTARDEIRRKQEYTEEPAV